LWAFAAQARADVAVLVEEPFGHYDQSGHVSIYLSRVCAETPTRLRRCRPDELGVVIARYHHVSSADWLAIPLIPYLYAVDPRASVPATMDAETETELREVWRRKHPETIALGRNWTQLAGASYDRRIYGFQLATTEAQDDAFIAAYNNKPNRSRFNILWRNCADFAAAVVNFYFPGAVRKDHVADLGIATPRQVARSVERYGRLHPELHETEFMIPQVAGTLPRSHRVKSLAQGLVTTKKYVIPMTIVCPPLTGVMAALWASDGHFRMPQTAPSMAELAR
jgi:hypothetical protein